MHSAEAGSTASVSAAAASALIAACGQNSSTPAGEADAGVVNLYTARHYDTDRALYDRFTEQTGVRVNIIEGNADQLIARMTSEGIRYSNIVPVQDIKPL